MSRDGYSRPDSDNQPLVQVIAMTNLGQYEPICGLCDGQLEGPANPNPQDTFRCVDCGNSDTLENINRIILEFVQDALAHQLTGTLAQVVGDSDKIKLSLSFKPKSGHRFFVNLKS